MVASSFAGASGNGTAGTGSSSGAAGGATGTSGSAAGASGSASGALDMTPVQIPNQMLAFSEIHLQSDGNGIGLLVGELALLPSEVDLSRRSLISQGFQVSAVHNHSATVSPELLFLHIAKRGNAMQMAQIIRMVMDQNRIAAGQISVPTGTSGSGSGTGTGSTSGGGSSSSGGGASGTR
jgi:hypothetical protein